MGAHQTYSVESTASYLIYRVGRMLRFKSAAYLKSACSEGSVLLTPEQWTMLLRVVEHPDSTPGDLADPVLNDCPNVTRLLDGLEKAGLVRRVANPEDGRSRRVRASEAGKKLVDELLPDAAEETGKFFEGMDERDVARLMELLKLVEQNLVNDPT